MRFPVVSAAVLSVILGTAASGQAPIATFGFVEGRVVDRISGQPLDSAVIQLAAEPSNVRRTIAGRSLAGGRFRFDSVPAGSYVAAFQHPLLDSLGLESPTVRFTVQGGRRARLELGTPTAAQVIAAICPAGSLGDSAALFLGHVRSARNGLPVPNAMISVRWTELLLGGPKIQHTVPTVAARSNAMGWFAFCNLPVGVDLLLQASSEADSSGLLLQQVPWRSIAHREVFVGPSASNADVRTDTGSSAERADRYAANVRVGPARIRGRVSGANGQPIAGAQIRVAGARSRAVSDANGSFSMNELPAGSQTLEVIALGFVPERLTVDLMAVEEAPLVLVTMTSTKHYLDTVRVTASRGYSRDLTGFDRRRKASLGRFITSEDINKRAAMFVSDYLQGMLGVSARAAGFGQIVTMLGGDGRVCFPVVYVDGLRFGGGLSGESVGESNIDTWAWPSDIDGIEVYTHASEVPPEFFTANDCGAIVLWTNRGRAHVKLRPKN